MMERDNPRRSMLAESARAHALMFETPLAPSYGNAAGIRMLLAFLVVGVVMFLALRFLAAAAGVRGLPAANLGFVVALLAAFVVAQRHSCACRWRPWACVDSRIGRCANACTC